MITESSKKKADLMDDLFECTNRIIHTPSISNEGARAYYEKYFGSKKIFVNNIEYSLVDNDGFYTYMYQSFPVRWVTADNGQEYLLFEYRNEGTV